MKFPHKKLRLVISIISILLILGHLVFPNIELDAVILFLLAFAVLPWLAPIISSFEVPGLKLEFQELEEAKENAKEVGLLSSTSEEEKSKFFPIFIQNDPNSAFAGLRIAIEDHLRKLVNSDDETDGKTINQILDRLRAIQIISEPEYNVLSKIIWLLNRAVHGADVDANSVQWVRDVGPLLIKALDEKFQGKSSKLLLS